MSLALSSYQPYTIQDINNGMLSTRNAMPMKDANAIGDSVFSQGREQYMRSHSSVSTTNATQLHKKWSRCQDSSTVTQRRQYDAIANGSLNFNEQPMNLAAHVEKNTVDDALRRVRSGGYVTSKKVRAKQGNAPTPSWKAGPLQRTDQRAPVTEWGVPTNGQYTTMRGKGQMNFFIPTLTNSGFYNRVRMQTQPAPTQPILYH
jgi:hypothetical protein